MGVSLVTGGNGFIGDRIVARLVAAGVPVRVLARSSPQKKRDSVEWVRQDLVTLSDPSVCADVDTIFHLAGRVHAFSATRSEDAAYFEVNTEGTRSLLRAAQAGGVRRFIFFSSIKAMSCGVGTSGQDPLDESATVVPDTPYGQSKLAAEKLVLDGGYVPEPVVLRLCMVYGPSGKGNLTAMIEAVRRNSFPPLPEVGNRRSMVHVDDVVEAALLAAEHPNAVKETFIVSDGCVYSTRQMYTLICRALDKPVPRWTTPLCILRAGATFGDLIGRLRGRRFVFDSIALQQLIGSAWFSSAKIQARLHYAPRWNLATALPAMVGA